VAPDGLGRCWWICPDLPGVRRWFGDPPNYGPAWLDGGADCIPGTYFDLDASGYDRHARAVTDVSAAALLQ
jgi:hypothetical protein